jgi:transaldolase
LATIYMSKCCKITNDQEGVMAAKYFLEWGIKTNVTLVFSTGQALTNWLGAIYSLMFQMTILVV